MLHTCKENNHCRSLFRYCIFEPNPSTMRCLIVVQHLRESKIKSKKWEFGRKFKNLGEKIRNLSKKIKKHLSRGGAQGAARSHLSKPQKESPRCSYSRSAIKVSLSCLRCRKPNFFSTPQAREAHFWPRAAQTAVRSLVFEHQKPTLWLQCGAFSSTSGTIALEALLKIKFDNTSSARASVFNRIGPGSHQNQNSCKSVTGAAVRRILAQKTTPVLEVSQGKFFCDTSAAEPLINNKVCVADVVQSARR
mgnify:CR=1 FL=1